MAEKLGKYMHETVWPSMADKCLPSCKKKKLLYIYKRERDRGMLYLLVYINYKQSYL